MFPSSSSAVRQLPASGSSSNTDATIARPPLLGLTKAETARVWLPFVPLACTAAASELQIGRLRGVLTGLAIQALAMEVLFFTIW